MSSNDERKMRELAERLAAMSPDAPPFPEETTVTSPSKQTSTLRPLTVFAGAALIVLLGLGIPLIIMNSGEAPVGTDTTTTTIAGTSTTAPETTTTSETPDTTVTTTPTTSYGSVLYLTQDPENSFLGNPAIIALETVVALEDGADDLDVLRATINMLGDPDLVVPEAFSNSVPEGVEALVIRRADGTDNALIIEMNEAFLDGAGGLLADFTMLNQLIYTATQLPDIEEVQFIVNNEQVTQFGSEGLDLSASVNRETFQNELNIIYLTSPILPNADGNIVVEGNSNTYEATMHARVLDPEGNIVHEELGTATSGSGEWGEYLFVLDPDHFEDGSSVQLLWYSPEDGSASNVITIPYNGGQPWDFLSGS